MTNSGSLTDEQFPAAFEAEVKHLAGHIVNDVREFYGVAMLPLVVTALARELDALAREEQS